MASIVGSKRFEVVRDNFYEKQRGNGYVSIFGGDAGGHRPIGLAGFPQSLPVPFSRHDRLFYNVWELPFDRIRLFCKLGIFKNFSLVRDHRSSMDHQLFIAKDSTPILFEERDPSRSFDADGPYHADRPAHFRLVDYA